MTRPPLSDAIRWLTSRGLIATLCQIIRSRSIGCQTSGPGPGRQCQNDVAGCLGNGNAQSTHRAANWATEPGSLPALGDDDQRPGLELFRQDHAHKRSLRLDRQEGRSPRGIEEKAARGQKDTMVRDTSLWL